MTNTAKASKRTPLRKWLKIIIPLLTIIAGGSFYKFVYLDKRGAQTQIHTNDFGDSSRVTNNKISANDNNRIDISSQGESKNNTNTDGVQFNNNGPATYNDNRKTTNTTVNLNAKPEPRLLTNRDTKALDSIPKNMVINVRFHTYTETINYANSIFDYLKSKGFNVTKTMIESSSSTKGYKRFGLEENLFGDQNTIDIVVENQ